MPKILSLKGDSFQRDDSSPLKLLTTIYHGQVLVKVAVKLVALTHPYATKFHIMTNTGVKALANGFQLSPHAPDNNSVSFEKSLSYFYPASEGSLPFSFNGQINQVTDDSRFLPRWYEAIADALLDETDADIFDFYMDFRDFVGGEEVIDSILYEEAGVVPQEDGTTLIRRMVVPEIDDVLVLSEAVKTYIIPWKVRYEKGAEIADWSEIWNRVVRITARNSLGVPIWVSPASGSITWTRYEGYRAFGRTVRVVIPLETQDTTSFELEVDLTEWGGSVTTYDMTSVVDIMGNYYVSYTWSYSVYMNMPVGGYVARMRVRAKRNRETLEYSAWNSQRTYTLILEDA